MVIATGLSRLAKKDENSVPSNMAIMALFQAVRIQNVASVPKTMPERIALMVAAR